MLIQKIDFDSFVQITERNITLQKNTASHLTITTHKNAIMLKLSTTRVIALQNDHKPSC